MKKIAYLTLAFLMFACGVKNEGREKEENLEAVQLLQGIWLDDNTEMPVLKVVGDSMYLASQVNAPFRFSISGDTLISHGMEQTAYLIKKLEDHVFQFYTSVGDLMTLHKAESDTIAFGYEEPEVVTPENEVIKKDSVFMYQGKRFRGYVYINPSTRKVIRPSVTEEGLEVDNIYYDNVIHICVYQGTQKMYSKDVTKDMFVGVVPDGFLQASILSDMDFLGVDGKGYKYRATVCMPEGTSCYYVDILISKDGEVVYRLKQ
ncbi:DUF4738 domain-containing protein [uncultured Bacteroides sp.]|uniref:DUF4738 domain-containing protein n=1 Tax=uncultured Bacteroides sp. TaxID=162156 RepID=UPI0026194D78|nr:DUF4738 domain-containing protein [uncultured Bacteroides sp.]